MSKNLKAVKPNQDFVQMEKDIMKFWEDNDIEKKYVERNRGAQKHFSFVDGPITANNPMGVHHAWGRTYKDIVQRFKNMQGFEQGSKMVFTVKDSGWRRCRKRIRFNSKKDIQDYGLDNTNQCMARVNKYAGVQQNNLRIRNVHGLGE